MPVLVLCDKCNVKLDGSDQRRITVEDTKPGFYGNRSRSYYFCASCRVQFWLTIDKWLKGGK